MQRNAAAVIFMALSLSVAAAPAKRPNEREWNLLSADYQWIETLRKASPAVSPEATRKEQIETLLEQHRKLEPTYVRFIDKLREYHERTGDPRAAALLAREKIFVGDEYMNNLSRYDRAIEFYQAALQLDPSSTEARQRLALAEQRRFLTMTSFTTVKKGMKESDVRRNLGLPREDWIKQLVQGSRVYSVWIYPKADGGAAAVYFDNGIVYHTNWNAAVPPAR